MYVSKIHHTLHHIISIGFLFCSNRYPEHNHFITEKCAVSKFHALNIYVILINKFEITHLSSLTYIDLFYKNKI